MGNIYFDLTRRFNEQGLTAVLSSGQAVVHYRLAMMSKDGDWIVAETPAACRTILDLLATHDARYRPGAPLDVRWLAGGWSSHFEFRDSAGRRIRCDFVSRPPRVPRERLKAMFAAPSPGRELPVVDLTSLILMKRTKRAKDYPVIGELARRLPPAEELEFTTDPDRILELARSHGAPSLRPPVRAARKTGRREDVVVALALETSEQQEADRRRLEVYAAAAAPYLDAVRSDRTLDRPLAEAHARLIELAERHLPRAPFAEGTEWNS